MAGKYESVDFNPVVVYPDNYYVVDAKIILRTLPSDDSISKSVPDSATWTSSLMQTRLP